MNETIRLPPKIHDRYAISEDRQSGRSYFTLRYHEGDEIRRFRLRGCTTWEEAIAERDRIFQSLIEEHGAQQMPVKLPKPKKRKPRTLKAADGSVLPRKRGRPIGSRNKNRKPKVANPAKLVRYRKPWVLKHPDFQKKWYFDHFKEAVEAYYLIEKISTPKKK